MPLIYHAAKVAREMDPQWAEQTQKAWAVLGGPLEAPKEEYPGELKELRRVNLLQKEKLTQSADYIAAIEREVTMQRDELRMIHAFIDEERRRIVHDFNVLSQSNTVENHINFARARTEAVKRLEDKVYKNIKKTFYALVKRLPDYFTRDPRNATEMFDELMNALEVFNEDAALTREINHIDKEKIVSLQDMIIRVHPEISFEGC